MVCCFFVSNFRLFFIWKAHHFYQNFKSPTGPNSSGYPCRGRILRSPPPPHPPPLLRLPPPPRCPGGLADAYGGHDLNSGPSVGAAPPNLPSGGGESNSRLFFSSGTNILPINFVIFVGQRVRLVKSGALSVGEPLSPPLPFPSSQLGAGSWELEVFSSTEIPPRF